jgi:hypothetical protein
MTVTGHRAETHRFSRTYPSHDPQHDYTRPETRDRDRTEGIGHYRCGAPAEKPTAAAIQSPGCGHNTVIAHRAAFHRLPAWTLRA